MSQWTHVAGCIRIDDIGSAMTGISSMGRFVMALGSFAPPEGSEGPLQVRIVETGSGHSLSWGLAYIWGDLRDYNDVQEIFEWAKAICGQLMVRQCVIAVDVEGGGSYVIHGGYGNNLTLAELEGNDE